MAVAKRVMVVRGMCPGEFCVMVGFRAGWAKDDSNLGWYHGAHCREATAKSSVSRVLRKYKLDRSAVVTEAEAAQSHGWTVADGCEPLTI